MQTGLLLLREPPANTKSACSALSAGSQAPQNPTRKELHKKKKSYRHCFFVGAGCPESSDFATPGTLKENIQALGKAKGWAMVLLFRA